MMFKLPKLRNAIFAVPVPEWQDPSYQSSAQLPDYQKAIREKDCTAIDLNSWTNAIQQTITEMMYLAGKKKIQDVEVLAINLLKNFKVYDSYITSCLIPQKLQANKEETLEPKVLDDLNNHYQEICSNLWMLGAFYTHPIYRNLTLRLMFSHKRQLEIRYTELQRRVLDLNTEFSIYLNYFQANTCCRASNQA